MSKSRIHTYLMAVLLIAVPAAFHAIFHGLYQPRHNELLVWIGPVSTTLNYAYLVFLFLVHCSIRGSSSLRSAYWGVGLGWLCMAALTVTIIVQSPAPEVTSGVPLAVRITSLYYLPYIALPYLAGVTLSWLWAIWEEKRRRNLPSRV